MNNKQTYYKVDKHLFIKLSCDLQLIVFVFHFTGGIDGIVKIWETSEDNTDTVKPFAEFSLSNDCINGVNMHKTLPILATSSGQRIFDYNENNSDNSVRLWHCGNETINTISSLNSIE